VRSTQVLEQAIAHLSALLSVDVEQFVVDRHPGYRTRHWALAAAAGRVVVEVQHHHAHAASLIIDSGHDPDEPFFAVAFDGAGSVRTGRFGVGRYCDARCGSHNGVASLDSVWQPGGDIAARRPYRMALSHLAAAGVPWTPDLPPVSACSPEELRVIAVQCRNGLASARTSSMGRLFDAMSSLTGICQDASYEAEAPMRLESMAESARAQDLRRYAFAVHDDDGLVRIDPSSVIAAVARDTTTGCDPAAIAFGFHQAVAGAVTDACRMLRARHGISTVGLTGGVFLNALLAELTHSRLTEADFTVLRHGRVPPSDAGIALGQIGVASARRG
jgi:hydrogenase maturation protein HypF